MNKKLLNLSYPPEYDQTNEYRIKRGTFTQHMNNHTNRDHHHLHDHPKNHHHVNDRYMYSKSSCPRPQSVMEHMQNPDNKPEQRDIRVFMSQKDTQCNSYSAPNSPSNNSYQAPNDMYNGTFYEGPQDGYPIDNALHRLDKPDIQAMESSDSPYCPYNNIETKITDINQIDPQTHCFDGTAYYGPLDGVPADTTLTNNQLITRQPNIVEVDGEPVVDDQIINEIVTEEIAGNNEFIKYLVDKNDLSKTENIPEIQDVAYLYSKKMVKEMFPSDIGNKKYAVFLMRAIQILLICFIAFGWMSPNRILKYHVFICIKMLVLWELLDDESYISSIITQLVGYTKNRDLIPANFKFCKILVIIVMFLSLYSLILPEYSTFNLLTGGVRYLSKYN